MLLKKNQMFNEIFVFATSAIFGNELYRFRRACNGTHLFSSNIEAIIRAERERTADVISIGLEQHYLFVIGLLTIRDVTFRNGGSQFGEK